MNIKEEKLNIINQLVSNYIKKVKYRFKSEISINTEILPDETNYEKMREAELYCEAKKLFSKINRNIFKNGEQNIYVTNSDISESIHKTVTNSEQKKYMKQNIVVFSKLNEIIEKGKLISFDKIDKKGRNEYYNYEYYVSNVKIDNKPYVVEFDTRLQVGTTGKIERHFRLERIYKI